MTDHTFDHPLYVFVGLDFIRPLSSIDEASTFLNEWPEPRRGPIYDTAVRACTAARDGYVTTDQARSAIQGFCRLTGVLASVAEASVGSASKEGGRAV